MARRRPVKSAASKGNLLQQGREALRNNAWATAYACLSAADRKPPLGGQDLMGLAIAAHLIGKDEESLRLLERAHRTFLDEDETQPAVRCAIWLAHTLQFRGDFAQAGGWLARAQRLLDGQRRCVEHGYLLLPQGLRAVMQGEIDKAHETFAKAVEIGLEYRENDLLAMALHGQGRAAIRRGEIAKGVALLDEAMVAVRTGEVNPLISGIVYCGVIDSCRETFDVRRAQEWTAALNDWCAAQPELVPYQGMCLLHRAEILQLRGSWPDALSEARRACEQMSTPPPKASLGAALNRLAELHRLRGEFAEAEKAYAQAKQWERAPEPGFARLQLAQGQRKAALAAIKRIVAEVQGGDVRVRVLDACVEIALAAGDYAIARDAADELMKIAAKHGAPLLGALSARANGAVLLAEGKPAAAMTALRDSWRVWLELEAPHELARTRVLIAQACREMGDKAAAELEFAAAREVFEQLGAATDLAALDAIESGETESPKNSLSDREIGVLRLVAAGMTNRKIATKLGISEKTVARHVSNIFNKLDLTSRAAATAYAYQNGLVGTSAT
jgi:ATP/maltotriose-dependent transcriptional regulator MalT